MAYARMGNDSDLFLVKTFRGFVCYGCKVIGDQYQNFQTEDIETVFNHVQEHIALGHKVPKHTIHRLKEEMISPQEVLDVIIEIKKIYPNLRIAQIIYNAVCRQIGRDDIFYVSDSAFLGYLQEELKRVKEFEASQELKA